MTDTIPPLLPCPRCGSEDICNTGHYVECEFCGLREENFYPVPKYIQAAKRWNAVDRPDKAYTEEIRLEINRLRWELKQLRYLVPEGCDTKCKVCLYHGKDAVKLAQENLELRARIKELEGD